MKTCVNTIKWLLWLLAVVFVITYVFSLNVENHFIVVNSRWFSNNFFFAIFSGAFASLIIVLAYEVIRYYQLRKETEDSMYFQFEGLYFHILQIKHTCERSLNGCYAITENMIQQIVNDATANLNAIFWIDYTPFRKKNKVFMALMYFKKNKYQNMKSVLTDFMYLTIAIQADRISLLRQRKPDTVTYNSPNTNATLNKIKRQTDTLLPLIDQNLKIIDKELGNRYNWPTMKQTIDNYQNSFTSKSLENYLSEDIIVL